MRDYVLPFVAIFILGLFLHDRLTASPTSSTAPADEPLNELRATPNDVHAIIFDRCTEVHSKSQSEGSPVHVCTSRIMETDFPFNELVPSWNIEVPPGAGFAVYIRLGRREADFWTPFYYFGSWREAPSSTRKLLRDANGIVRIDHFQSKHVFDRIQYRVESSGPPIVGRFALAHSNMLNDPLLAHEHRKQIDAPSKKKWTRRLPVPFQSQATDDPDRRGRLCSPISVAMVMAYRGIKRDEASVCEEVWDPEYKIYGNWSRAIQTAYTFGLPGYLERFNDWNQVKRYIAADQPIIASVKIKKGQIHTDPKRESSGHLLVITGFDEGGNIHVNDPAYLSADHGITTYTKKEMDEIWLANGGLGYVLQAP